VTVGRLVARKAVDQLITLMERLDDRRVRLLVIGSGPLESALKADTHRRRVEQRVTFLGQVRDDEKFRILSLADLYVSTSQHEGFGLVFVEAMACGLPILCYNRGGQGDFLEDGKTGYLVPLNDLKLFEARCRELICDDALRRTMSEYNRHRAEDLFIDRCAERYEKVLRDVIAGCGATT